MPSFPITVAITTFNRCGLLGRAIQSVLVQSWPGIEIVVVDDASTDGTQDFIAHNYPQVCYLRQDQNQGCGAARNRALQEATNSYVLILDDDDTLLPDSLALIATRLQAFPDLHRYPVVNFAHGNAGLCTSYMVASLEDYLSESLCGDFVPIICRELFLRENLMYPLSRVGGEHILWWKIAKHYGIPTWADQVGSVNTDAPIRLTSVRSQMCHAHEHAELQERTLKEFAEILRLRFHALYKKRLLGAAAYRLLAGDRAAARSHLRTSLWLGPSKSVVALWTLSFLPLSVVRKCFLAYRRKSGVNA
jgi:GalNAc5-diNAcBac-PP-undecaprenol beta-1,3-glucosyltransferase